MELGIKIGPVGWREKLNNELSIRCSEIYFDFARIEAYPEMFAWLHEHNIPARLHSSTLLPHGIVPNLAAADSDIRQSSLELFKKTVDIAVENDFRFVIFHPGSYHAQRVVDQCDRLIGERIPEEEGNGFVMENALALSEYAGKQDVTVLAENLPRYDFNCYAPVNREEIVDCGFLPYQVLLTLAQQGISLCLDIGHLYAEMITKTDGPWFQAIMEVSKLLAPYVRHLHLSTSTPPFNGTDSHNGFLPADYEQGAIPKLSELAEWLKLFTAKDTWAVPEPFGGTDVHLENYRVLRRVVPG